jgi:hypothetical protein
MRTDLDRAEALQFVNDLRTAHELAPLDQLLPWRGCTPPLNASLLPLRTRVSHHTIWVNQPGRIRSWTLPPGVARFVDACWHGAWPDLGSIESLDCPNERHHVECPMSFTRATLRAA